MNKAKYLRSQMEDLHKKLDIKANIELKRDNRLGHYVAHVAKHSCQGCYDNYWIFRYNGKKIKKATKLEIIMVILHEFGHIIQQHYSRQGKPNIQKEYEAEKFALEHINKYFPKQYNKALRFIKEYITHDDKIYRLAFTKLYEELKNG